jgi:hypothetical protein
VVLAQPESKEYFNIKVLSDIVKLVTKSEEIPDEIQNKS